MEDREIVELYFLRSQRAIEESDLKYGGYCRSIAFNICNNNEDAEECVSDTWFKTWNIIPPKRPDPLRPFLGSITRNTALDRWRENKALKRGGGEIEFSLQELGEVIPDGTEPEKEVELKELQNAVRNFIHGLPESDRRAFLGRYYFVMPVREIAKRQGSSISQVKMSLFRTRKRLAEYLRKEGLC